MAATNMKELREMIMSEMQAAMDEASDLILEEMKLKTARFYTKGKPKMYIRTGALGETPKVTDITRNGNLMYFDAYLDQSHQYTTGTFTMRNVMERAESTHFRSGILGHPKFWSDSEKKMQRLLDRAMRKHFKK